VRILVVTPDYVSHLYPLIPLALGLRASGHQVTFGTGPSIAQQVRRWGFGVSPLVQGYESNQGLADVTSNPQVAKSLQASEESWLASIVDQARNRVEGLFYDGLNVARRTIAVVKELRPDYVISVQLSYGAALGLFTWGGPFVTYVTGHPNQLPREDAIYGDPGRMPLCFSASSDQLRQARYACQLAQETFTDEFNLAATRLGWSPNSWANGLAAASPTQVYYNFPRNFDDLESRARDVRTTYLGPQVRPSGLTTIEKRWVSQSQSDRRRIVYVGLGSYFSNSRGTTAKLIAALGKTDHAVAFSAGHLTDYVKSLAPSHWLVSPYLSQPSLLSSADLAISHGGNNSFNEAYSAILIDG